MVIVMAILALIAGLLGMKIGKSMQEQRFRTEVASIVDRIRLAQNLMLILNEDVKLNFKKVDNGILLELSFDCQQTKGWEKEFARPKLLSAIRKIEFKSLNDGKKLEEFCLDFMSGGAVMSQGTLSLSTGKGKLYNNCHYVELPGHPSPIKSVSKKGALLKTNSSSSDSLTQFIIAEINSKKQINQP